MNIGVILQATESSPATAAALVVCVAGPPKMLVKKLLVVRVSVTTRTNRASAGVVVVLALVMALESFAGSVCRKVIVAMPIGALPVAKYCPLTVRSAPVLLIAEVARVIESDARSSSAAPASAAASAAS